jgi:L-lactate dehydrogenase (cytochrome)
VVSEKTSGPEFRPRSIAQSRNWRDMRALARLRLPAPIFHYLEGGAEDEVTARRNLSAFSEIGLLPRTLSDTTGLDISTSLLGRRIAMPVICAPTGMTRMFHAGAEPAVARAAARAGTFYALSTMATTSLEDIAALSDGPKMFQIYVFRDRELTNEFVDRCAASRFDALCVTVDTVVAGNRERDLATGMRMPPRFDLRGLASFAMTPRWVLDYLRGPGFELANVRHRVDALKAQQMSIMEYVGSQFDRSVSWADVEKLRQRWSGPFVIKGVQSVADARRAMDIGATAIMVSNHGGRQLDGTLAPIELVSRMREVCGDGIELIVDGGIRRGTDVVKAIASGADACSIGRPYLYGLVAGGEAGVDRVLTLLREEMERTMILLGASRLSELGPGFIERRAGR